MTALAGLLITRDSATWLPYVLANLREWADEVVVVVDKASQDATLSIAQSLADRVEQWDVGGYLENVMQPAAQLCRSPWIMRLDDDELMPPGFRADADYLMGLAYDDYFTNRLHLVERGWHMADVARTWPDPQIRLRSQEAYATCPWPIEAHAWPAARRRVRINTRATTIWHLHYLLRSTQERAAQQARIAAAHPVMAAQADFPAPWHCIPAPPERPAQLDALLNAVGRPYYPVAQAAAQHDPATHMRQGSGPAQLAGLQELIDLLPDHAMLAEVGVFAGEATRLFAQSAKVRRIYAIDNWQFADDDPSTGYFAPAAVEAAFDVVAHAFPSTIFKLKAHSPQVASCFYDGELDLVYIDADHTYEAVAADLAAWLPKVKRGGILAGHDANLPGVIRAVREAFGKVDGVFQDSSWWLRVPV